MFTPAGEGGIGRARTKAPGGELLAPLSRDDDDSGGVTGMLCEMVESGPPEYRNVNWGTSALVRASSSSSCGLVANAKKKAADFRGHEGHWLNEKELKDALGRKPGFQERGKEPVASAPDLRIPLFGTDFILVDVQGSDLPALYSILGTEDRIVRAPKEAEDEVNSREERRFRARRCCCGMTVTVTFSPV